MALDFPAWQKDGLFLPPLEKGGPRGRWERRGHEFWQGGPSVLRGGAWLIVDPAENELAGDGPIEETAAPIGKAAGGPKAADRPVELLRRRLATCDRGLETEKVVDARFEQKGVEAAVADQAFDDTSLGLE